MTYFGKGKNRNISRESVSGREEKDAPNMFKIDNGTF